MKKKTLVLAATAFWIVASTASAQWEPGALTIRPEVGGSIASTFGVAFGGVMSYAMSENAAVGPYFGFSTAGRSWEGGDGQNSFKTKGSNSLFFGGRFSYLITPDSDFPWYVDAGAGVVKFGSVSEFDDGNKIRLDTGGQVEDMEVKGSTRFAANFGSGTMIPVGENAMLVFDVNSYVGSHGDIKGKTASQDDIDISGLFDGGTFWLLNFTVGMDFAF